MKYMYEKGKAEQKNVRFPNTIILECIDLKTLIKNFITW